MGLGISDRLSDKAYAGENVPFSPPELREITKENLFDAQQDALLFE